MLSQRLSSKLIAKILHGRLCTILDLEKAMAAFPLDSRFLKVLDKTRHQKTARQMFYFYWQMQSDFFKEVAPYAKAK